MATKNYMINDKWLDLDKQNIVELQSVDGVLDSLKVNGSEIETPSGKITITENGTDIDVAQYALADVNVEGGGGSSDFSTAEVTILVAPTFSENLTWNFAYILDFPGGEGGMSNGDYIVRRESSPDIKSAILYKGNASLYAPVPSGFNLSISGNITDDGDGYYIITGDCTITIS